MLKKLTILPLIFYFLPAFSFWMPGLNKAYSYFFLLLYLFLVLLFILKPQNIINKFINIAKTTPLKIFLVVLLLIALNGLLHFYMGKEFLLSSIRSIFMQIILCIMPFLIYFLYIIDNHISFKRFFKFFIILSWIIMFLGIVEGIIRIFDLNVIVGVFNLFANARLITGEQVQSLGQGYGYNVGLLPRLDGFYEEPSWYARNIFLFLPLFYSIGFSKLEFISNNFLNLFIKRTLVPLAWISLVFTLSPIFIILGIITTILYFTKKILKFIKKNFLIVTLIFILLILSTIILLSDFSMDKDVPIISRILVLFTIKSMQDFVVEASSLANRITNYINTFIIFTEHPFFGIGIGNLRNVIETQLLNSPIPLTQETITNIIRARQLNIPIIFNGGYIYVFLAQNGIFIFSIFAYFWYTLYKKVKKANTFFSNISPYYSTITKGLKGCIVSVFILMFYDYSFTDLELYMIMILSIVMLTKYKRIKRYIEEIRNDRQKNFVFNADISISSK